MTDKATGSVEAVREKVAAAEKRAAYKTGQRPDAAGSELHPMRANVDFGDVSGRPREVYLALWESLGLICRRKR